MPRFALRLDFDGAGFAGTQIQGKGERTLEGVLGPILAGLAGGAGTARLSSRLDAGVSAAGLVADVDLGRDWAAGHGGLPALVHALNRDLPDDVAVTAAAAVDDAFDANRQARGKTYRYRILRRDVRPVLDRRAWWLKRMDEPHRLAACAGLIVGRHDLSGFACLRHDGTDEDDPVRTVHAANWSATPAEDGLGEIHTFRISGSGFLYKQIRGLVGAMVFIAQTRASVDDFRATMAAGRAAERIGNIAPAEGLCLVGVDYGPREPAWVAAPPAGLPSTAGG
jgi:tRNA pseudouridine38-40 synthase